MIFCLSKYVDVQEHPFEHLILDLTCYVNPGDTFITILGLWSSVGVIFPIGIIFLLFFMFVWWLFFVFCFCYLVSGQLFQPLRTRFSLFTFFNSFLKFIMIITVLIHYIIFYYLITSFNGINIAPLTK